VDWPRTSRALSRLSASRTTPMGLSLQDVPNLLRILRCQDGRCEAVPNSLCVSHDGIVLETLVHTLVDRPTSHDRQVDDSACFPIIQIGYGDDQHASELGRFSLLPRSNGSHGTKD
jgi:hypothetical protein